VQSAVLRSHVVRLFVCDVGGLWSHRFDSWKLIAQTISPTSSLFGEKAIHLLPAEHGEILERLEVAVGKSGVLENKSGKISETHKDRGKVTMDGL